MNVREIASGATAVEWIAGKRVRGSDLWIVVAMNIMHVGVIVMVVIVVPSLGVVLGASAAWHGSGSELVAVA